MKPRLLITGANGQVGWRLQSMLVSLGDVTALTREHLDLGDLDAVTRTLHDLHPDVVVNAGAYTAVDKAESEPDLALAVNALAPGRMAEELARTGGLLLHYSTDYIFDGTKLSPYVETDSPAPLNVYGLTKLKGERLISASGCDHLILRTTWVYDTRGKNFLRTVLRLAREKEELRMVGDQVGAPTWASAIAEATASILVKSLSQRETKGQPVKGVYHLTAAGQTSWAGFAKAIIDDYRTEYQAGQEDFDLVMRSIHSEAGPEFSQPLRAQLVTPIRTEEYPTPARRPRYSVLSNAKVQTAFGVKMSDWREQLRLALRTAIRG